MTARNTIASLVEAGLAGEPERAVLEKVAALHAVAITPALAGLIDRDDPADPIARQFVPGAEELTVAPEERRDPIGDDAHAPVAGIVHRHKDRVLFKIANACPAYCRFCFRRTMIGPGSDAVLAPDKLDAAFAYIAQHKEIWEVIFTGGDPFILSPRRIAEAMSRLAVMDHVKIARWHTRVPVIDPQRIDNDFTAALKNARITPYVVIHANHPREFTADARAAMSKLADAAIPLLSQTVLLKGINDNLDTLEALMRCFAENRITPYYLHHPDLAPGTSHFRPSIAEGQKLVRTLRARLSGIAMPSYVLDIPGGYAKVPLLSDDVVAMEPGHYRLRDHDGRWHLYPPEA